MQSLQVSIVVAIGITFAAVEWAGHPCVFGQTIVNVYIAQTHVHDTASGKWDNLETIVSNRETLIKAQIVAANNSSDLAAPNVVAILNLNNNTKKITMKGPSKLSRDFISDYGRVQHKFDDSFIAYIPPGWVQKGLRIEVEAGNGKPYIISSLKIGAPIPMNMIMIDFYFFGRTNDQDYVPGGLEEFESRLPISSLKLIRTKAAFNELVIVPRENVSAVKIASKEDYKNKTGLNFDGEQSSALAWTNALRKAAGIGLPHTYYYGNIYNVVAGGLGGGYSAVGNGNGPGILLHETGHALGLPHSCPGLKEDPFKYEMFGIKSPAVDNVELGRVGRTEADNPEISHVGPIWGFDMVNKIFLNPTDASNDNKSYKRDPMCGGGLNKGGQEGIILRHFSPYSVDLMRQYLETQVATYNFTSRKYMKLNTSSGLYMEIKSNGLDYPTIRKVMVLSILVQLTIGDPNKNAQLSIVYPPIGPYKAGIIDTFDPLIPGDRKRSREKKFCPAAGCDYSMRITQKGAVKTYIMPVSYNSSVSMLSPSSLKTFAINVRFADGPISRVELLCTPDADKEPNDRSSNPCPANLADWNA